MEDTGKDAIQWHPAFYADMQIELREEAHKLIFQNEYPLSKKPMLIDILTIKKKTGEKIHKNIGRIFRTYNLIEYKSPKDYLSIDDFYKVYGYACFYKADTGKTNEIPAEELTITFVSNYYPQKMIRHLKNARKYTIEEMEPGIYYVHGDIIAIQIIVTSQLSPEHNLWLYSLTDSLNDSKITNQLLDDYRGKEKNNLYSAVMQTIVKANEEQFKQGGNGMCDALMQIIEGEVNERVEQRLEQRFKEELPKRLDEEVHKRVDAEVHKRIDEEVHKRIDAEVHKKIDEEVHKRIDTEVHKKIEQANIFSIKSLIETLKLTADQAMEALQIKDDEKGKYRKMLQI